MLKRKSFLAFALLTLFAIAVSAHDTWLLGRQPSVSPGDVAQFDLTSGMAFPTLESPIRPERINVARCRLNGKTFEITDRSTSSTSMVLAVRLPDPGIATLWVELKPRALELTPNQVEEYFDEINAPAALRESWKNGKAKRWREIYTKHAKTFLPVGKTDNDHSWLEPVGMSLEIVPEKSPASLRAGEEFSVRVLRNGNPLSNFSLGVVAEGNTLIEYKQTDVNGRVSFRLARSGKWLLRGTDLRPSRKPETEWESDFTTLTIFVR